MKMAKIEAGHVSQVIVCDSSDWAESSIDGEWVEAVDQEGNEAGIGMRLSDGKFVDEGQQKP